MKFRVTLKDPDTLTDAIQDAVNDIDLGGLDADEAEAASVPLDARAYREAMSLRRYAALAGYPADRWTVVRRPEPGCWYDFSDIDTGHFGQCFLNHDGSWKQAPRGADPVILEFRGKGKVAEAANEATILVNGVPRVLVVNPAANGEAKGA